MYSTEVIEALEDDFKLLKSKGIEGEEELHYLGFIHGSLFGLSQGKRFTIERACEWLESRLEFGCPPGGGKGIVYEFKKEMEEQ